LVMATWWMNDIDLPTKCTLATLWFCSIWSFILSQLSVIKDYVVSA
jgi:hypothetical protein